MISDDATKLFLVRILSVRGREVARTNRNQHTPQPLLRLRFRRFALVVGLLGTIC
jgi:hypothetical protein